MKTRKTHSSSRTPKRRGRALHRRIALHPVSILLLLCTGVLMVVATYQSHALTLDISATVPADPITTPAIITSHHDQQHVITPTIAVSGTCVSDSYVKLFRNAVFSGTALCVSNVFTIQTSLNTGPNQLQVKIYNLTDNEGPPSPTITIFYDPPVTPIPATETPTPAPPIQSPLEIPLQPLIGLKLTLTHDYRYQVRYTGEAWEWHLTIVGGSPPYTLSIHWGDGTTTTLDPNSLATPIITHTFTAAGNYEPVIQVTDTEGGIVSLQLLAVVKARANTVTSSAPGSLHDIREYLWIAWPAYTIVSLMVVSFWLGEYEIIQRLARHKVRHH